MGIKLTNTQFIEIFLGLFCTVLLLIVALFNIPFISTFIKQMDGKIYDQFVSLNWHSHQQNPRVVIINIDEYSVQKEGRWPWPRDRMALLVSKLKQAGVVTIGLDIVMSEAEVNYALGLKKKLEQLDPIPSPEQKKLMYTLETIAPKIDNDQIFAQTLLDHNVVLGFLFQHETDVKKGVLPPPLNYQSNIPIKENQPPLSTFEGYNGTLDLFLKASTQAGFVTNFPDTDGIVRHALVLARYNNKIYPSLALKIAINYLLVENTELLIHDQKIYGIQLDGTFIPTNSRGQILIPFFGGPGTLDYYSATDILHDKVDKKELDSSIAIIGSSMTLLADLHDSPVAPLFPGVEMVGNIVQGIVGQQLASEYSWRTPQGIILLIFFGVLFSLIFPFVGILGKLLVTLISIFLIFSATLLLFVFKSFYVSSTLLITLIILQALINYAYSYIIERRQKRQINQLFGQYVPEQYVKELIESPEQYSMEGQTLNMTVQFADIRNFTSISESLDAVGVKHLLNTFFTPITEIIFSYRGTIDKYVGDMIVAFWGAPIADEHHAYNAIMSSLSIFQHLPEINAKMKENNLPQVNIGLGLATGLMNVGDMGSEFRRAYTVLGDTVNLASRLQDLTKFYQVDILANDTARFETDTFLWRAIDKVSVKGRKTALTIYQPLGLLSEASPEILNELEEYNKALIDYYAQNWLAAEIKFTELHSQNPELYLYQLYLERILIFKKTPPPKDWDGVYAHLHK
nr:adenylate/guanylate cyclase domain-containing protein [Legionella maioricensis]